MGRGKQSFANAISVLQNCPTDWEPLSFHQLLRCDAMLVNSGAQLSNKTNSYHWAAFFKESPVTFPETVGWAQEVFPPRLTFQPRVCVALPQPLLVDSLTGHATTIIRSGDFLSNRPGGEFAKARTHRHWSTSGRDAFAGRDGTNSLLPLLLH